VSIDLPPSRKFRFAIEPYDDRTDRNPQTHRCEGIAARDMNDCHEALEFLRDLNGFEPGPDE